MNKIIVVGNILLFIGIGFQSVISIEFNNSNVIVKNDDDPHCFLFGYISGEYDSFEKIGNS